MLGDGLASPAIWEVEVEISSLDSCSEPNEQLRTKRHKFDTQSASQWCVPPAIMGGELWEEWGGASPPGFEWQSIWVSAARLGK